mmetsp:Transcript_8512/g.20920  ORF Transcript_8512/g.20920 Transcript_8512/m.20920 type:complete len:328 (-) Transcript_8512:9-992(-)
MLPRKFVGRGSLGNRGILVSCLAFADPVGVVGIGEFLLNSARVFCVARDLACPTGTSVFVYEWRRGKGNHTVVQLHRMLLVHAIGLLTREPFVPGQTGSIFRIVALPPASPPVASGAAGCAVSASAPALASVFAAAVLGGFFLASLAFLFPLTTARASAAFVAIAICSRFCNWNCNRNFNSILSPIPFGLTPDMFLPVFVLEGLGEGLVFGFLVPSRHVGFFVVFVFVFLFVFGFNSFLLFCSERWLRIEFLWLVVHKVSKIDLTSWSCSMSTAGIWFDFSTPYYSNCMIDERTVCGCSQISRSFQPRPYYYYCVVLSWEESCLIIN